ncbi:MAG TPA: hypothetical protein VGD87_14035 [Archangium sp.]
MTRIIALTFSVCLPACQEHATFLAVTDLPMVEAPIRSHSAPNPVVGTLRSGALIMDAPVISGIDYRYFQVPIQDGGVGFIRAGGPRMQIYRED